jgi:hypothetical protein
VNPAARPDAPALRWPNNKLLEAWKLECSRHENITYLFHGFRCSCGVEYDGDLEDHRIEEACANYARDQRERVPSAKIRELANLLANEVLEGTEPYHKLETARQLLAALSAPAEPAKEDQ